MNIQSKYNPSSAIYKDRWIAVYINYDKGIEITSFLERIYDTDFINESCKTSYFQKYELDNSKLLRIYYKTNYFQYVQDLKPFLFKEFNQFFASYQNPEINVISFEEFAWVSHYGLSKVVVETILPIASKVVYDLQQSSEDWGIDTAIEKSFVLDLGLLFAFGLNKEEIHHFYNWLFEERMKTIQIPEGQLNFIEQLINEFKVNYEGHKELMFNYVDLLITEFNGSLAFEEEWITLWFEKCKLTFVEIEEKKADYKLIVPNEFVANTNCLIHLENQKLWPIYGHLLEVIHGMMEISFLYELNMLFALKEATK